MFHTAAGEERGEGKKGPKNKKSSSVTAGSLTACPTEDFGEGEDLKLILPTEYSMNEGNEVIPAASRRSCSMTPAVRSS